MKAASPLKEFAIVVGLYGLVGCVPPAPPAVAVVRAPVPVTATFANAWEASVDVFADKNIGIRTLDRSSGLIVADPVTVPIKPSNPRTPLELADCGRNEFGYYEQPTGATYNVRVRGDSARSTVLVTVRWTTATSLACTSTGVWEREFEKLVKEKAEAKPH